MLKYKIKHPGHLQPCFSDLALPWASSQVIVRMAGGDEGAGTAVKGGLLGKRRWVTWTLKPLARAHPLNDSCISLKAHACCMSRIHTSRLKEEDRVSFHLNECSAISNNPVFVLLNRSQIHIFSLSPV